MEAIELTEQLLKKMLPAAADANIKKYFPYFKKYLPKFGINTPKQTAAFFATIGHESANLSVATENLNYSAQGLLKTFPKYFNAKTAEQYARQPEKIANRVYANRMGNGDEASGDGWKYRGRSILQITGKDNHRQLTAAFKDSGLDFVKNPELLETPEWAVQATLWWWKNRNLNEIMG